MADPDAIFKNGGDLWMSIKVKCKLVYIAIHQAIQYHQHYCSMLCNLWDIMTFLLTTAIFKNGARESRKIPQKSIWNALPIGYIYTHTTIVSLDETVINVRRNQIWRPFFKWPLNHYGKNGNKIFQVLYSISMILKSVAKIIPSNMLPLHLLTH